MKLVSILLATFSIIDCGVHVDRIEVDTNIQVCNTSFTHYDDPNGDGVVNGTFQNFKTITKIMFYTKMKIAEDQNDKEFRRVILSTVCDAEKMLNGMQGHLWLKSFADVIRRSLDFEFKTPFLPVSRFLNVKTVYYVLLREFTESSTLLSVQSSTFWHSTLGGCLTCESLEKWQEATRLNISPIISSTVVCDKT